MASLHVVFDPTDLLQLRRDHMPKGLCFAVLSVPDLVEDPIEIEALARRLATLLLEQMKPVAD